MKIIGFIEDDEIIEKILRHLGLWETRSHGNRIPAQNPHKMVEEDLRFHQMLCELSGNKKLLQVWQTIEGQLRIFIVLEEARYDAYDQFVKGHQEVISAIRKKSRSCGNIIERPFKRGLGNYSQYLFQDTPLT